MLYKLLFVALYGLKRCKWSYERNQDKLSASSQYKNGQIKVCKTYLYRGHTLKLYHNVISTVFHEGLIESKIPLPSLEKVFKTSHCFVTGVGKYMLWTCSLLITSFFRIG